MKLIKILNEIAEGEVVDFSKAKQKREEQQKKKPSNLQLAKERLRKLGYDTKD